jgi:hypothetical protein
VISLVPSRPPGVVMVLLCALLMPLAGLAQEQTPKASARVEQGPHYVGVGTTLQVTVQGVEDAPKPEIAPPAINGATLELVQIKPNVSTRLEMSNGQWRRWRSVRFDYQYRLTPTSDGEILVGSFIVTQGALQLQTEPLKLVAGALASASGQHLKVVIPKDAQWVSRAFDMDVEWWISEDTAPRVGSRLLRIPAMMLTEQFRIETPDLPDAQMEITVETPSGLQPLPAIGRRDIHNAQPYLVFTVRLHLTPLVPGKFEIEPATIVVEEVVRWTRNVFGDRVPRSSRRNTAATQTRILEVKDAPVEGRPRDYTGALGFGLDLSVDAERSVVNVGDPIDLTLRVRGDTTLKTLSLPDARDMGLPEADYAITGAPATGVVTDDVTGNVKTFTITVRPQHAGVRSIPPLTLSWFDPATERFERATSEPIALAVSTIKTISAGDVIRATTAIVDPSITTPTPDVETPTTVANSTASTARFAGADLAIETNIAALTTSPNAWWTRTQWWVGAQVAGLLVIAAGVWMRRRTGRGDALVQSRRRLDTLRAELTTSQTHEDLAVSLGQIARGSLQFDQSLFGPLMAACDAARFAPDTDSDRQPALTEAAKVNATLLAQSLEMPS